MRKKSVSAKELKRSKTGIKSSFVFSLQNLESLADHLNLYNFYRNEPNSFAYDLNRYNKVKREDISDVAEKYLSKPYVELRIVPKENNNGN